MQPMASQDRERAEPGPGDLLTVTELARDLDVTARAIRFYETKGLLSPSRVGTTRVYGKRDYVRMKLILRGKRLGFSLRDIKNFLDLYDADPTQRVQMQSLLDSIRRRRDELEEQRAALSETLVELEVLERQAKEALDNATRRAPTKKAG
jgi:DNA-binding transcriptional MerR regulator